jgi:hypothetical protein
MSPFFDSERIVILKLSVHSKKLFTSDIFHYITEMQAKLFYSSLFSRRPLELIARFQKLSDCKPDLFEAFTRGHLNILPGCWCNKQLVAGLGPATNYYLPVQLFPKKLRQGKRSLVYIRVDVIIHPGWKWCFQPIFPRCI